MSERCPHCNTIAYHARSVGCCLPSENQPAIADVMHEFTLGRILESRKTVVSDLGPVVHWQIDLLLEKQKPI